VISSQIFINGRYLSQAVTGVQRYATETIRALDSLIDAGEYAAPRWQFNLLAPPGSWQRPSLKGIAVRAVGRTRGQLWEQLELPLHACPGLLLNFANTAPLAVRRQCVTIHDASVFAIPTAYSPAFRAWYRMLLPTLGRRAARVLTVSGYSRDELTRWAGIPRERISVVPGAGEHILAVPPNSEVFRKHGIGGRPYVLAVGSTSSHKNLQGIEQSLEFVVCGDFDVVVAGGRNLRVFGPNGAAAHQRIQAIGYVTDGELRALYERAACLVFPSFYEGFGLPPLEAMACGCAVIASSTTSLPEVCGDAALYCDPSDPRDIAAQISAVLSRPELATELRDRALARSRLFSWKTTARAVMRVVEGITRESP
jgi:glycosyltransferase involved in cell wall biosynthesis